VLVISGSQQLAHKFHSQDKMPLIPLGLILFSAATSFLNSKYFLQVPHPKRIAVGLVVSGLGLALFGGSTLFDHECMFFVAALGAVLVGVGQAVGESVMVGYLGRGPAGVVAGWGVGTGVAGPVPALLYLVHQAL
jgi:hypothetical protein